MLAIIGFVLLIAGAVIVLVIFVSAAPRAAALTVRPAVRSREMLVKERILLERISRVARSWGEGRFRSWQTFFRNTGARLREQYRSLRIRAQEYATPKRDAAPPTCASLIASARAALADEEYDRAEEQFLACLKVDAKHRDAYLGLSELYRARREHGLAEETLTFLRKLYPEDAEVAFLLAGLLRERGKDSAALREAGAAVERAPLNPKYLDFAITCAMVLRKPSVARRWIAQLRKANPENQKLAEFEEQLEELDR